MLIHMRIFMYWSVLFLIDVKIVPVKETYNDRPLEIAMLQGDEGNIIDIPVENYMKFKGNYHYFILGLVYSHICA